MDIKRNEINARQVPSLLDSQVSRIVDEPVYSILGRLVSRIIDGFRFIFPIKERACVRACACVLAVCSNV